MQSHPAVRESLVFGLEDFEVQELISAVVSVNPGHEVTEEEIKSFVNDKVIDFKKIRGPIIFKNDIPRNSVGKLMRRELRTWGKRQAESQK